MESQGGGAMPEMSFKYLEGCNNAVKYNVKMSFFFDLD